MCDFVKLRGMLLSDYRFIIKVFVKSSVKTRVFGDIIVRNAFLTMPGRSSSLSYDNNTNKYHWTVEEEAFIEFIKVIQQSSRWD